MGLLGSVFDAVTGGDAQNAADAQVGASKEAIGSINNYYGQARDQLAPYSNVGQNALYQLAGIYGLGNQTDTKRQNAVNWLFDHDQDNNLYNRLGLSSAEQDYDFGALTDDQINQFNWEGNRQKLRTLRDLASQPQSEAQTEPDYSAFYKSPGYQFRLNEGVDALENSAAARGMLNSGAAARGITEFGQNYASNEYGNYINQLMGLSGMGQSADTNTAQLTASQGNALAGLQTGIGNARASGYVGQGNAIRGLIGSAAQAFGASFGGK